MADIQLRIRSDSSTAQREIQALRRELATLRGQLDQTERSADGAGNEIDQLGDESQQTATQIGRMGDAAQRTSRETQGLTRGVGAATGGTQVFTRSLGSLGGVLGGLGLVAAGAGVLRVGANSVEASVRVEGFRNSLTALYGSAQIANTVLADLQELSLLPGITFQSAVQGAVRLKTVGVEGDRALGVVREFGNAAALAGASTDAVGRSLVGFTQILSRGKISQEELNQILENVPLIGNSIREAFGSIDAEVIRDQLDAAGQSVQDFADILVNQLSKGARASADSTRNAFSNLENATFRLHAAIGDRLSPAVREATGFLTDLANTAADFVSGIDDATRSATSYADALMMASNAAAINAAIQSRIEFLRQEKTALDEAAEGSANFFRLRGRETGAGAQYREITEELGELTAALTNTATAAEHFGDIQNQLLSEARDITQNITDLEAQRAGETARAYGTTTRRIREQREELAETQKEIGENAVVLRALASAQTVVTAETEKATTATEESTKAVKEATVEIITYAEAIKQVQANIAAYIEEQALFADFGDFFRFARGEIEGYGDAIETVIPSLANLKNEQDAFNASIQAGIDAANEAVGDPISDYIDGLDQTSEAADRAFGSINQVGEAIRNADFRAAAAELTDFDSAFQLSEATIPRVTSAMREFTGTAPDIEKVERAVEQTTRSIDDLLDSVERVPGEVEDAFSLAERSILGVLDQVPGFLIDIAQDDADITEAFGELGDRIGQSLIGELSGTLTDQLGAVITDAIAGADGAGAGAGGLGGASAGIVSLLTSPVALAAIVPAAVFFATKYIGDQFGETGTIDDPNRQGRPSQDDPLRRRGESQAAYEARIGVGAGVDDDPVRTATRDGTRRIGTGASTPGRASVSDGRRRRGTGPEEHENVAPPGHRYNATLGVYEPIPVIFDEDASGGSGLGVPIAVAAQETLPGSEAGVQAAAEAAAAAAESVQMRIAAEMLYSETVQGIYNSVAEAFEAAEERKTEIIQRAAEQRVIADMRLAETQQDIYNDVVDAHETSEERKTDISERATEQRTDAEQIYVDTVQGIYNSVAEAFEAAEERKTEIAERATEQRGDVDMRLADTQQGIYNSVADAFEDAEERKTDIAERATEQRGDADDRLLETQQGIYNSVADAYQASQDRITDIAERATDRRGDTELRYAESVQDIHNGLFLTVTDIQENLTDTLGDLRQQELDTEADRLDSLAELHEDTAERIADIERGQARTREDIVDRYNETRADAELRAQRQIEEINANAGLSEEERAERIARVQRDTQRRQQDAGIRYNRDIEALATDRIQRLEDTHRQAAATEIQIAEQTAERVAAIQVQGTEAETSAAGAISEAEAGAGITFAEAQSAFVPAADAMTVALTTLNDTIAGINTSETEAIAGVDTTFAEVLQTAGVPLTDALNNAVEPMDRWTAALETHATAITGINTGETTALGTVDDNFAEVLQTAGVPLTEALNNAVEPMDRWTAALTTHATAITDINTGETLAITDVDDRFADVLETAGVPLTEALNNAQEPMTLFATATDRLSTSLDTINDNETSLLDTETDNFNAFLDVAGVTLPDALANAVEPMDRWTAALDTHSTAITGINTGETSALGTVDDRFAEVLQTAGVPLTVALNNSQEPMSRMAAALETYNSNPVVFGAPQAPLALSPGQVGGNLQTSGGIAGTPQAAATPGAAIVNNNITVVVDLGDGVLTKVEGRLATRADQGLSVLNV